MPFCLILFSFIFYLLSDIYFVKLIIFLNAGARLLSHAVSSTVPSAARVLTFVFGMETGVSHGRIGTSNF